MRMESVFFTLLRSMACQKRQYQRFFKNKKMIKAANVAKGSKVTSKQRPLIIKEVEKSLLVLINEKQLKGPLMKPLSVKM